MLYTVPTMMGSVKLEPPKDPSGPAPAAQDNYDGGGCNSEAVDAFALLNICASRISSSATFPMERLAYCYRLRYLEI